LWDAFYFMKMWVRSCRAGALTRDFSFKFALQ
jgi:hypothetical protein